MSAMWSRLRRQTPKHQPQPFVPSRTPCLICMDLDLEADDRNPLISDIHHSAKLGCAGCSVLDVLLAPYKLETSDTSQIRIGQSSMTESSNPMGRNLRLDNLPSSPSRLEVFTSRGELRILVFPSQSTYKVYRAIFNPTSVPRQPCKTMPTNLMKG